MAGSIHSAVLPFCVPRYSWLKDIWVVSIWSCHEYCALNIHAQVVTSIVVFFCLFIYLFTDWLMQHVYCAVYVWYMCAIMCACIYGYACMCVCVGQGPVLGVFPWWVYRILFFFLRQALSLCLKLLHWQAWLPLSSHGLLSPATLCWSHMWATMPG